MADLRITGGILLVAFVLHAPAVLGAEPNGKEIADRMEEAQRANSEVATFEMKIVNSKGKEKIRRLKSWSLSPEGEPERAMIRFLDPPDVAGTSVLTIEQPEGEDEQWMYLPALKRTRRIAGAGRNESFMGSDLSYDDLRPREVGAYAYQVLRSEKLGNDDVWVLEATPSKGGKAEDSAYSRTVGWVRKTDYVPLKNELYDKSGKLLKTVAFDGYAKEAGVMRPGTVTVRNEQKGSRTELSYAAREINADIGADQFTTRALEAP